MDTKHSPESQSSVIENPNGGYHIHIQIDEREPNATLDQLLNPCPSNAAKHASAGRDVNVRGLRPLRAQR